MIYNLIQPWLCGIPKNSLHLILLSLELKLWPWSRIWKPCKSYVLIYVWWVLTCKAYLIIFMATMFLSFTTHNNLIWCSRRVQTLYTNVPSVRLWLWSGASPSMSLHTTLLLSFSLSSIVVDRSETIWLAFYFTVFMINISPDICPDCPYPLLLGGVTTGSLATSWINTTVSLGIIDDQVIFDQLSFNKVYWSKSLTQDRPWIPAWLGPKFSVFTIFHI